jgi:ribonuclease Z
MRVIFCGTAGGPFTQDRASSGLVLEHGGHRIMLDCGPGSLRVAIQAGIAPRSIEAVLLSHIHPDHVLDLASFVFQQRYSDWPLPPVYGPPGSAKVIAAASDYVAVTPSRLRPATAGTIEIAGSDEREICGIRVHSEETPHAPDLVASARRFTAGGTSIVYTGDTQPNPATLVPLSERTDVLIHEAYSQEALERSASALPSPLGERLLAAYRATHTEVLHAAAIARDAGVRRLVLTHLGQEERAADIRAKAAGVFRGEITVAYDGLVLDI